MVNNGHPNTYVCAYKSIFIPLYKFFQRKCVFATQYNLQFNYFSNLISSLSLHSSICWNEKQRIEEKIKNIINQLERINSSDGIVHWFCVFSTNITNIHTYVHKIWRDYNKYIIYICSFCVKNIQVKCIRIFHAE